MMRIECPWCGLRSEDEFVYGGEAQKERPSEPAEISDEAWSIYLYQRDNVKGETHELWQHRHGCGQWFTLVRNTVSHTVVSVASGVESPAISSDSDS